MGARQSKTVKKEEIVESVVEPITDETVTTPEPVEPIEVPVDARYNAIDQSLAEYNSVKAILDSQVTSVARAKSDILAESHDYLVPIDFPFPVEPDARIITLQRNLKSILVKVNELAEAYMVDECRRRVQGTDKATVSALKERAEAAKTTYSMLRTTMPMLGIPVDPEKYPELDKLATPRLRSSETDNTPKTTRSGEAATFHMEYSIDGTPKPNYKFSRAVWYTTVYRDENLGKDVAAYGVDQIKPLIREQMGNADINPELHEFDVKVELPNGKTRTLSARRVNH